MHPGTITERRNGSEVIGRVTIIPSSFVNMNKFVACEIGEGDVPDAFFKKPVYEALYLCAMAVLPEFQRQKIAISLTRQAIETFLATDSVTCLFSWPVTKSGADLVTKIASEFDLPIKMRGG
jgi:ribosomal protein S18 acetylase RimI-like enzyme